MAVVIPTVGRPSLHALLAALLPQLPAHVPVTCVDDRPASRSGPLAVGTGVRLLTSGGRGPAAARNTGWRATSADWVAFLDDDVLPPPGWWDALLADLTAADADPTVGGVQGRVRVPLPAYRRPTDWERGTAGLQDAVWATADLAYRRAALEQVDGFDERFPRAYREDADLGLRVIQAGWRITLGQRTITHPVRPARWTASITAQRGNRDDVLMRALHGPYWRLHAHVGAGRRRWHLTTTAAALLAVGPRPLRRPAALLWGALTTDFAVRRIVPGPRSVHEIVVMTVTSCAIPLAATWHWLVGWATLRRVLAAPRTGPIATPPAVPPAVPPG